MIKLTNIYSKLSNIQSKLKVNKKNFNKNNNYYYRNLEDILEKLKPLLLENNLCQIITDEIVNIGDRYYVKSKVILIDLDKPEDKVESIAYARESLIKDSLDKSQVTGSTSTYARKYALNGLYNISDTLDFDTDINSELIDYNSRKRLYKIGRGYEKIAEKILLDYGYNSSLEIKKQDFENIIDDLDEMIFKEKGDLN